MITLNDEQQKVIDSKAKRKLLICGPGSGKTRTLCAGVADAVRRGRKPEAIVVVTYTNAAAAEVEQRLRDECGLAERLGFVGTLHAFCLALVRGHAVALGLPDTVSVVDDSQREELLESVREEMGVKCSARKAAELLAASKGADPGGTPTAEKLLVKEYHRRLRSAGMLDFDTILAYGLAVVRHSGLTGWPYECLFWDEGQDMADVDFDFLAACPCDEKLVVGDADQAIYGFRGGNVGRFVQLSNYDYWETHLLEMNYRSGSVICDHAQQLIMLNTGRIHKWTRPNRKGGTVAAHGCDTPAEELGYVLEEVRRLNAHNDIAVLARTNRLADSFAEHLMANGVPVRRAQEQAEPADWRRTKLLLTVLDNPWNDFAVAAFLRADRPDDWKSQVRDASANMVSLNEFLGFPFGKGDSGVLELDKHGVSAESRDRVNEAVRELAGRGSWTVADLLLHLGAQEEARKEEGEGVTCATIHSAKGREWRHVFVVGCEEGVVPSSRSKTPAEVEEERRLMYVAMTRAAETLTLTWCRARPQWRGDKVPPGPMEVKVPSRFLKEAGL
jgi:DNA helicase II / ATP-dependent DNA helicase PcrA